MNAVRVRGMRRTWFEPLPSPYENTSPARLGVPDFEA